MRLRMNRKKHTIRGNRTPEGLVSVAAVQNKPSTTAPMGLLEVTAMFSAVARKNINSVSVITNVVAVVATGESAHT